MPAGLCRLIPIYTTSQGAGCDSCVDRVSCLCVYWSRRRTGRKEKPQEPPKVMVDVPSHPCDPVEMRRLNFQTPGKRRHCKLDALFTQVGSVEFTMGIRSQEKVIWNNDASLGRE